MSVKAKMRFIARADRFEGPALVMDATARNELLGAVQVAMEQYAKDRDMFRNMDSKMMTEAAAERLAEEFDRKVRVMEHFQEELE